jgi:hypothetical protein
MCSPRSSRAAALGLVLAALVPATAVANQDLRSPDARDQPTATTAQSQYLWGALEPPAAATAPVDLRAPDSRDVAEHHSAGKAPSPMIVRMPQRTHESGGTDWGDVGLGASGALIILTLSAGGAVAVQRRRQGRSSRTPAAA